MRLKDEADFAAAYVGEAVIGHGLDGLPVYVIAAGSGYIEAPDDVHQGRFARSGCAHDGNEFAVVDVHGYTVECSDLDGAHVVHLGDIAYANYGVVAIVCVVHDRPAVVWLVCRRLGGSTSGRSADRHRTGNGTPNWLVSAPTTVMSMVSPSEMPSSITVQKSSEIPRVTLRGWIDPSSFDIRSIGSLTEPNSACIGTSSLSFCSRITTSATALSPSGN